MTVPDHVPGEGEWVEIFVNVLPEETELAPVEQGGMSAMAQPDQGLLRTGVAVVTPGSSRSLLPAERPREAPATTRTMTFDMPRLAIVAPGYDTWFTTDTRIRKSGTGKHLRTFPKKSDGMRAKPRQH